MIRKINDKGAMGNQQLIIFSLSFCSFHPARSEKNISDRL
jgi:hypothetical protein